MQFFLLKVQIDVAEKVNNDQIGNSGAGLDDSGTDVIIMETSTATGKLARFN